MNDHSRDAVIYHDFVNSVNGLNFPSFISRPYIGVYYVCRGTTNIVERFLLLDLLTQLGEFQPCSFFRSFLYSLFAFRTFWPRKKSDGKSKFKPESQKNGVSFRIETNVSSKLPSPWRLLRFWRIFTARIKSKKRFTKSE